MLSITTDSQFEQVYWTQVSRHHQLWRSMPYSSLFKQLFGIQITQYSAMIKHTLFQIGRSTCRTLEEEYNASTNTALLRKFITCRSTNICRLNRPKHGLRRCLLGDPFVGSAALDYRPLIHTFDKEMLAKCWCEWINCWLSLPMMLI